MSAFSAVSSSDSIHMGNTLGFVSHSSGNYLVNMGSINFARTLRGTYKLILEIVAYQVI